MSTTLTTWEAANVKKFNELPPMTANEVDRLMEAVPHAKFGYTSLSRHERDNLHVFVELAGKHIRVREFGIVDSDGLRCSNWAKRPNALLRVDLVGAEGQGRSLASRGVDLGRWTSQCISYFNWNTVDDDAIAKLRAAYEPVKAAEEAAKANGDKTWQWPTDVRRPLFMAGMYSPKLEGFSTVLVRVAS